MERIQVPLFELERLKELYNNPFKPLPSGPTVSLEIVNPDILLSSCTLLAKLHTKEPQPGLHRPFYVVIVVRSSAPKGTTPKGRLRWLYEVASELAHRVLKAFANEDMRGVYCYAHVIPSNTGGFSQDLHNFIAEAGAKGIAMRFLLIGLDAMCAAELLAVQLMQWQEKANVELMVYQHKFCGALQSHPCTADRCMPFSEEP